MEHVSELRLLAEAIRQARIEKRLSQEQLAEEMGVSRQTVTKWESGKGFPEVQKGICIAALLQVSMDWLFEDELIEQGWEPSDNDDRRNNSVEEEQVAHRKINEEIIQKTLDKLYEPVVKGKLTTGIECLDIVSKGMSRGYVYYLLGDTGIGRMPFAMNIVNHFIEENRRVMIVVKNHTIQNILRQAICIGADVSSYTHHEKYSNEENERVKKVAERYSKANLILNDSYDESVEKLYEICINTKEQLDLVVIDNVGLLHTVHEGRDKEANKRNINYILKNIARECRCPVLVIDKLDDKTVGDLRCHENPERIVEDCVGLNTKYKYEHLIIIHRDGFYMIPDDNEDFKMNIIYYSGIREDGIKCMTCSVNKHSYKISNLDQKISYIITPWRIIETVCQHFHVGIDDIRSDKHDEETVIQRQIAMYLCSKYTDCSAEQIGKYLCRDHSTVLHGISQVENMLDKNDYVVKSLEVIEKKLGLNASQA